MSKWADCLSRRRIRWLLVVCACGLLGLTATGCRNWAIGDSITDQSRDEIGAQFKSAGWNYGIAAQGGQRIDQMRDELQAAVADEPNLQRVFINLGTNDVAQIQAGNYSLQSAKDQLHAAVHDVINVRPHACVFLVSVKVMPGSSSTWTYAANELRQDMKDIVAAFPNVYLIDWDYLSKPHDGGPGEDNWFDTSFYGLPHLTQAGQNSLADYYRFFGSSASGCG